MSTTIGDDTVYLPSDKTVVAYSGTKHLLVADGDTIQRILMSAFAESGEGVPEHDHDDDTLKARYYTYATSYDALIFGQSPSYIQFYKSNNALDIYSQYNMTMHPGLRFQIYNGSGVYAQEIVGTVGKRYALSDGWDTYACSERFKTDITPIVDPVSKILSISGVTFTQDGKPGGGITAEDLDKLEIPNATHKNENGEYEGVNLTMVIPVLVEAFKAQEEEISSLQAEILSLTTIVSDLKQRIQILEGETHS
jgi:hypothetical protein